MSFKYKMLENVIEWNEFFAEQKGNEFFKKHKDNQTPHITLVSCCDSRVHPHALLEKPINNIFAVNVIGNAFDAAVGSIDYGIYHLETPVLMILGHSDCGAVKACLAGYEGENEAIKASLNPVAESFQSGVCSCLKDNIAKNIHHQVAVAAERYKALIENNKLLVVGAYYDIANDFDTGKGKLIICNINGEEAEDQF